MGTYARAHTLPLDIGGSRGAPQPLSLTDRRDARRSTLPAACPSSTDHFLAVCLSISLAYLLACLPASPHICLLDTLISYCVAMIESASCPIFFFLRYVCYLSCQFVTCHLFQININLINSEQYVRRIWPVVFFSFLITLLYPCIIGYRKQ